MIFFLTANLIVQCLAVYGGAPWWNILIAIALLVIKWLNP